MLHARLLIYLDEVVRQGSIRKAAELLNVSASAISRQILVLENQMRVPLFYRSGRRLSLTSAGELLIRHVRETLKEMSRTEALIEGLKGLTRGSISIGLMSGLAANIVPRAAAMFSERNPHVELKLRLMMTEEQILTAVEKGEVDLGLGYDFPNRQTVRVAHIAAGRLGAVMGIKHPLSNAPELWLADCARFPLALADSTTAVRLYIDQAFSRSHLKPFVAVETNSIEIMRHIAMMGQNITFLTPFDIEGERRDGRLVYIPVHELGRRTQQLMLLESERRPNGLACVFAEELKTLMSAA